MIQEVFADNVPVSQENACICICWEFNWVQMDINMWINPSPF